MLSFINDDDVMDALVTKLCKDDILLERLRTALFPETATTSTTTSCSVVVIPNATPEVEPKNRTNDLVIHPSSEQGQENIIQKEDASCIRIDTEMCIRTAAPVKDDTAATVLPVQKPETIVPRDESTKSSSVPSPSADANTTAVAGTCASPSSVARECSSSVEGSVDASPSYVDQLNALIHQKLQTLDGIIQEEYRNKLIVTTHLKAIQTCLKSIPTMDEAIFLTLQESIEAMIELCSPLSPPQACLSLPTKVVTPPEQIVRSLQVPVRSRSTTSVIHEKQNTVLTEAKTDQPLKQNILAMKRTNGQNTSADETTTPSQQEVQPRTNIAPVAGFGTLISGRNDPDPLSVDFLAAAIIRIFWKDKQNDQKHTRTPLSQPLRTFPPIPKKCYRRQTHRRNEYR